MENWAIKHISKMKLQKHFENPTLDKLLSTFFLVVKLLENVCVDPCKNRIVGKDGKKGRSRSNFIS